MFDRFVYKNSIYFYLVFRVIIGLLFLLHGIQKVSGLSSGKISLFSLMGVAMVIEIVAGIFFIVGLFTRYVAIFTAVEMLVAYFMVHFSGSWNPLLNKGEPALLFFSAFLIFLISGSGSFSLDNLFFKK